MPALSETDPREVDMKPEVVAGVAELVERQQREGLHPGAQLVVFRHGRCVLDRSLGLARVSEGMAVSPDTLFVLFSATKPLAAACIFRQVDQGKLRLSDPVAAHWPEFARNGKETITVAQVLSHQAGLPLSPRWLTWEHFGNRQLVARAMEERTPSWPPGTAAGYHPLTCGRILGELVWRVAGCSLGTLLRREILAPLGIDGAYLGLPAKLEATVAHHYTLEEGPLAVADFNRPEVHRVEVPAAGLIATARALARFYLMMLGEGALDGVRVLSAESVRQATSLAVEANPDRTLRVPVRWAFGFHLGGASLSIFGRHSNRRTFGHGGHGSISAWADPDLGLVCVYVTNGIRGPMANTRRHAAVADGLRAACR